MKKSLTAVLLLLFFCISSLPAYAGNAAENTKAGKSPYYIMVNRLANTITIYAKGDDGYYSVPYKSMICSCGRSGTETPLGTHTISDKYRWRFMIGDVYTQYDSRFCNGCLFHSLCYSAPSPSTMLRDGYNRLGQKASHGCIRLQTEDAKWIYENCPAGTKVTVYDSSYPGALGKPEKAVSNITAAMHNGYDPTDPVPSNPWLKKLYIYYTNASVFIDNNEIPAYADIASDKILIAVEDLMYYGFNIDYIESERTVYAKQNPDLPCAPISAQTNKTNAGAIWRRIRIGSPLKVVISAFGEDHEIKTVYDAYGYACIRAEDLKWIFPYDHRYSERSIYITVKRPRIMLNGEVSAISPEPVAENGIVYLPFTQTFDALGIKSYFDGDEKTAHIIKGEDSFIVALGELKYYKNGEEKACAYPARLFGNYAYIPQDLLKDISGADISWKDDTKTVLISYNK